VIEADDELVTRRPLRSEGFREVPMWFTTPVHAVWHRDDHRAVDVHVVVLTRQGAGVYGDEGIYPAEGLNGRGTIAGRMVRCTGPCGSARRRALPNAQPGVRAVTAAVGTDVPTGHSGVLDRLELSLDLRFRRTGRQLPLEVGIGW
jgi:hypothetical protein